MLWFNTELRKSDKALIIAEAELSKAIEAAAKRGVDINDKEAIEGEIVPERIAMDTAEDEYRLIRDRAWIRKMYQLELTVPSQFDRSLWDYSPFFPQKLLTDEGFNLVRAKVREEQKQRRHPLITFITLGIGLIGAATGFVAVIAALT